MGYLFLDLDLGLLKIDFLLVQLDEAAPVLAELTEPIVVAQCCEVWTRLLAGLAI